MNQLFLSLLNTTQRASKQGLFPDRALLELHPPSFSRFHSTWVTATNPTTGTSPLGWAPWSSLLALLVLQTKYCAPSPGCFLPSEVASSVLGSHYPTKKHGTAFTTASLPFPTSYINCKECETTARCWHCTFSSLWHVMRVKCIAHQEPYITGLFSCF